MKSRRKLFKVLFGRVTQLWFVKLLIVILGASPTVAGELIYVTNLDSPPQGSTISVVDTWANTVVASIPVGANPSQVAITPDGTRAYITHKTQARPDQVSVIDMGTNTVVATIPVGDSLWGISITPDGARAYVVAQLSRTVSVIDTTTNSMVATIAVGNYPTGIAITPDGTRAYVTLVSDHSVVVIDTKIDRVVATVPVGSGSPIGVAVTPDGTRAYVTNYRGFRLDGTVSVIDVATNTVVATVTVGMDPENVAITPDGTRAYVTNMESNSVSVIDTATNTVIATLPVGGSPQGVGITPDGAYAYAANTGSNTVSVLDTLTNSVVATVPAEKGPRGVGIPSIDVRRVQFLTPVEGDVVSGPNRFLWAAQQPVVLPLLPVVFEVWDSEADVWSEIPPGPAPDFGPGGGITNVLDTTTLPLGPALLRARAFNDPEGLRGATINVTVSSGPSEASSLAGQDEQGRASPQVCSCTGMTLQTTGASAFFNHPLRRNPPRRVPLGEDPEFLSTNFEIIAQLRAGDNPASCKEFQEVKGTNTVWVREEGIRIGTVRSPTGRAQATAMAFL